MDLLEKRMAENDIYNSKLKYENFIKNLPSFAVPPEKRVDQKRFRGKYHCKHKDNLKHFTKLFACFDARDTSYVRRNRLINSMRLICHVAPGNLPDLDRDDIDRIVSYMHSVYSSPKSKSDFIKDIRFMWRQLFPERDERGRIDENIMPYAVRHLNRKIDKSRERRRRDKLTWDEFEKIMHYFSKDPRMQCYLSLALESLGRPQEMLYIRLRDVDIYDNYAKVWISEHGKEGTGFLQCIDSYPYLTRWLESHPFKGDDDCFLFVNTGHDHFGDQLKPKNINKQLSAACRALEIDKPVTAYSLKRNGVTLRRLRGESDLEIQHAARWTSSKQLKTYDMSSHDDAMKVALAKRGLLDVGTNESTGQERKTCSFCETLNGFDAVACSSCKRPLDRRKIVEEEQQRNSQISFVREELEKMKQEMASRSALDNDLNTFMQIPQVQDLFKQLHKVRKEAHRESEKTAVKIMSTAG